MQTKQEIDDLVVAGIMKKKKYSNGSSNTPAKFDFRHCEILFKCEVFGYRHKHSDKFFKKSFKFNKITEFNSTVTEDDIKFSGWKYGFQLKTNDRTYTLMVATENEKIKWEKAFRKIGDINNYILKKRKVIYDIQSKKIREFSGTLEKQESNFGSLLFEKSQDMDKKIKVDSDKNKIINNNINNNNNQSIKNEDLGANKKILKNFIQFDDDKTNPNKKNLIEENLVKKQQLSKSPPQKSSKNVLMEKENGSADIENLELGMEGIPRRNLLYPMFIQSIVGIKKSTPSKNQSLLNSKLKESIISDTKTQTNYKNIYINREELHDWQYYDDNLEKTNAIENLVDKLKLNKMPLEVKKFAPENLLWSGLERNKKYDIEEKPFEVKNDTQNNNTNFNDNKEGADNENKNIKSINVKQILIDNVRALNDYRPPSKIINDKNNASLILEKSISIGNIYINATNALQNTMEITSPTPEIITSNKKLSTYKNILGQGLFKTLIQDTMQLNNHPKFSVLNVEATNHNPDEDSNLYIPVHHKDKLQSRNKYKVSQLVGKVDDKLVNHFLFKHKDGFNLNDINFDENEKNKRNRKTDSSIILDFDEVHTGFDPHTDKKVVNKISQSKIIQEAFKNFKLKKLTEITQTEQTKKTYSDIELWEEFKRLEKMRIIQPGFLDDWE